MPSEQPSAQSRLGPVGQFAAKTVIVTAAIMVAGWLTLDYIDDIIGRRVDQLEATLRPMTALGGRQFWTRLEQALDRQADPAADIPPEKKQKLLAEIRIIADRWRPFLREASAAISGEATAPATGSAAPAEGK